MTGDEEFTAPFFSYDLVWLTLGNSDETTGSHFLCCYLFLAFFNAFDVLQVPL